MSTDVFPVAFVRNPSISTHGRVYHYIDNDFSAVSTSMSEVSHQAAERGHTIFWPADLGQAKVVIKAKSLEALYDDLFKACYTGLSGIVYDVVFGRTESGNYGNESYSHPIKQHLTSKAMAPIIRAIGDASMQSPVRHEQRDAVVKAANALADAIEKQAR